MDKCFVDIVRFVLVDCKKQEVFARIQTVRSRPKLRGKQFVYDKLKLSDVKGWQPGKSIFQKKPEMTISGVFLYVENDSDKISDRLGTSRHF